MLMACKPHVGLLRRLMIYINTPQLDILIEEKNFETEK
jgi:hypothetical protein